MDSGSRASRSPSLVRRAEFFVIHNLRAIRAALDQIHHADNAQRLTFQSQAAEFCAFRKIIGKCFRLFLLQTRWRVHVPMDMRAGDCVRAFLKCFQTTGSKKGEDNKRSY